MRISDWSSDVCSSDLAQYKLALLYQYGRGVERDLAKAAELYRAAAEQGLAEAQHNLGYLYERGLGVGRNPAEAAVWYRRAAITGLPAARLTRAKPSPMGDGGPPTAPLAGTVGGRDAG